MSIRYVSQVKKSHLQRFYKEQLYMPGRLFGLLYNNPEDFPYDMNAVVSKEGDEINGVCIYMDNYKFGWKGPVDGIVGVYVKPEHRGKGIAGKLLKRMLIRNNKVLGHTYDLNKVAKKIKSERLKELSW